MLVERDHQLGVLGAAADRAATGRGSVVLVTGEAGIGKTALVTEFLGTVRNAAVLWGACDDLATPRTFGPLYDIGRGHPAVASALRDGSHTDVYEAFLIVLSPPTGLAVGVIEDAHWADQATIDAIRYVGRRAAHGHGMLVVTARTEAISGDHPLRLAFGGIPPDSVERIELPPLSRDGIVALSSSHPVDEMLAITGGNPFFVTELLDSGFDLPRSVVDSVLARAAKLGSPARELLALVAVVPGETERDLIEAIHPDPAPALAEAEAAGLVVSTSVTVRFRHELARRAAEAALTAERRRTANRAVLGHLQDADADPARLVHHAEQAGDLDVVARWAPVAARRAAAARAHREAVEHLYRVAAVLERYPADEVASLLELLAWELYVLGRVGEGLGFAERAVAVRSELGDPVALGNALRLLSRVRWMRGDRRQAEGAAEEAIDVLEPLGESRDLAFAYSTRSQLAMLANEDEAAIRWGSVAVDMARRLDAPQILSHALNNVGAATALRGDMADGLRLLSEARAVAVEQGLDEDAARAWINEVWSLLRDRRYRQVGPVLEAAIDFVHGVQQDGFEAYLVATRAIHRLDTGDWEGAERDARWALEQPAGVATTEFPALSTLGTLLARRGEFAEAHTVLDRGWRRAVSSTELQRTFPMAAAMAELSWLEERPADGVHALTSLEAELARHGTRWERSEAAFWRARAGLDVAVPDDAPGPIRLWFAGEYRAAAEAWQGLGAPYNAADVLSDSDRATDLEQARAVMQELGAAAAVDRLTRRLAEVRALTRTVVTVLFTDIVGSTEIAGRLGDAAWRALLDRHDSVTAQMVTRHGGRVVKGTGDGVMASFDSPSGAIDAATDLVAALDAIGVAIRAGLHTGEVVVRGDDLGGTAVHIAARVGAGASSGQVLVSSTTRDLVVGGSRVLIDVGTRQLKGLADEWRLYEVAT